MIQKVIERLESNGWKLHPSGDCYLVETPSGKWMCVNIRWKTKPVWGKRARRWEWSVPLRDWQRYINAGVMGMFVYERSTGIIHVACIHQLQPEARVYNGDDLDRGGTVFLPVSSYKRLATVKV